MKKSLLVVLFGLVLHSAYAWELGFPVAPRLRENFNEHMRTHYDFVSRDPPSARLASINGMRNTAVTQVRSAGERWRDMDHVFSAMADTLEGMHFDGLQLSPRVTILLIIYMSSILASALTAAVNAQIGNFVSAANFLQEAQVAFSELMTVYAFMQGTR